MHDSAKPAARIAKKVHIRLHPRLDRRHISLTEVGEHVPGSVVHECEYLLALSRILADRDIKIRHVSIERSRHSAVPDVEFGGTHARLGRLDAGIHIADLC